MTNVQTLLAKAAEAEQHLQAAGAALTDARALLRTAKREGPHDLGRRADDIAWALDRAAILTAARHLGLTGARAAKAEEILRTCSDETVAGASIAETLSQAVAK